jgi:glycosyltransferase 2 family protein
MKRSALAGVKVGISLALLAYLFSVTDLAAFEQRLRSADLVPLAAAVSSYVAMLALATWRWRILLEGLGVAAPLRRLTASYLVATFFNNFLPSNIGGDVVRVRDGSRFAGSTAASLAVVGIDRILGFGALYVLAAAAFLLGGPVVRGFAGARVVLAALALLFGALAYVFFRPGTARAMMSASRLVRVGWIREQFEAAQVAVHAYRARLRTVFLAFAASLVLQALVVWYYVAVARSLRIPLLLSAAFLMVPLCTLLQAVPVSFNGWGLREGLFTVYFAQAGLPRESALAFSLVGAGLMVLLSLSGALAWMARSHEAPVEPPTG